jgi:hypothetical protein
MAEETEVLGETLHFVHHKSHMTRPGFEPGKPANNRLSYGAALHLSCSALFIFTKSREKYR